MGQLADFYRCTNGCKRVIGLLITVASLGLATTPVVVNADSNDGVSNKVAFGSISSEGENTCAVTISNGLKCWGYNTSGSLTLDPGVTAFSRTPIDISGLTSNVDSVSVGNGHVCAVTTSGAVKCWGNNDSGQTGNDLSIPSYTPYNVVGLSSGVLSISAGSNFTCALTSAGGVKCWGRNSSGQLGNNSLADSITPVDVQGLTTGVNSIAAGTAHACALLVSGSLKCWGYNNGGQLGNGTLVNSSVPVDVVGISGSVSAVSAGLTHTCAVLSSGAAQCWGDNTYGQLGTGALGTVGTPPTSVAGLTSGVTGLSAAEAHTCVLMSSGGVKCWGGNTQGQLGDGSDSTRLSPVDVAGMTSGVISLSVGAIHSCSLLSSGAVTCWGNALSRALGTDPMGLYFTTPQATSGLMSNVTAVDSGGGSQSCAIKTDGSAQCWGTNNYGQTGSGSSLSYLISPTPVVGLGSGVTSMSTGDGHTCAVQNGAAKCWGLNSSGQLGDGTTTNTSAPVTVAGLGSGVAQISVGSLHTCALTTAGAVKCWGSGIYGQLGNNDIANSSTPVDVSGMTSGIAQIDLGASHSCAVTTSGGAKCWGYNARGRLGNGTTSSEKVPVDVTGLTSLVASISAGYDNTCAVTTSGGAKCWGSGIAGQTGSSSAVATNSTPLDVYGLTTGVQFISAGRFASCAITVSGNAKCWGQNTHGQLGNNSTTSTWSAADVFGLSSGATQINASADKVCALVSGGSQCWGYADGGLLGIGLSNRSLTPVSVAELASGFGATTTSTTTTTTTATATTTTSSTPSRPSMTVRKRSKTTMTKILRNRSRNASVRYSTTRSCRILAGKLVAPNKRVTCTVTMAVTTSTKVSGRTVKRTTRTLKDVLVR